MDKKQLRKTISMSTTLNGGNRLKGSGVARLAPQLSIALTKNEPGRAPRPDENIYQRPERRKKPSKL